MAFLFKSHPTSPPFPSPSLSYFPLFPHNLATSFLHSCFFFSLLSSRPVSLSLPSSATCYLAYCSPSPVTSFTFFSLFPSLPVTLFLYIHPLSLLCSHSNAPLPPSSPFSLPLISLFFPYFSISPSAPHPLSHMTSFLPFPFLSLFLFLFLSFPSSLPHPPTCQQDGGGEGDWALLSQVKIASKISSQVRE